MPRPTSPDEPSLFYHVNLQSANNVEVTPFPTPTPLMAGVWITLDNRNFRIAFADGVLAGGGGLTLWKSAKTVWFFPCADANLLRVASNGSNGRIAIMAG